MRTAPFLHARAPARRRRRARGQNLVEFALVGGLFFALVIGTMNAGFFLYGRNAVDHAADVGVAALAALGNCSNGTNCSGSNADKVAISRMDAAGLTTTPLITVTEIDIWKETESSSGAFSDDTTDCTNSQHSGWCENVYNASGVLQNPNSGGTAPWDPSTRNISASPDFAKLVITYNYNPFAGAYSYSLSLSTTNVFRLEPQI